MVLSHSWAVAVVEAVDSDNLDQDDGGGKSLWSRSLLDDKIEVGDELDSEVRDVAKVIPRLLQDLYSRMDGGVFFFVGKKQILGGQEEHGFDFGCNEFDMPLSNLGAVIICSVVEDMDFRFVRYVQNMDGLRRMGCCYRTEN